MKKYSENDVAHSQRKVKRVNNIFQSHHDLLEEVLSEKERTLKEVVDYHKNFDEIMSKISLLYLSDYEDIDEETEDPSKIVEHLGTPYLSPIWRQLCLYLDYSELMNDKNFDKPGYGMSENSQVDSEDKEEPAENNKDDEYMQVEVMSIDEEATATPNPRSFVTG